MATAKIATLAIRTLAKPIATQIKHQAAEHQRFRAICISLAQFMHRTEMILRTNLLAPPKSSSSSSSSSSHSDNKKDGSRSSDSGGSGSGGGGGEGEKTASPSRPKIRPLNEAKAVANGANALAEGFLFALAAALILGESYRGSRSRAKQRDRTEEDLHELSLLVRALSEKVGPAGVDFEELKRRAAVLKLEEEADEGESGEEDKAGKGIGSGDNEGDEKGGDAHVILLQRETKRAREDNERLQHAVSVLLRLALKSGWIQGQEGLRLESILQGTDEREGEKETGKKEEGEGGGTVGQQNSGRSNDGKGQSLSQTEQTGEQLSIIDQVAQARARRIAREVRFGNNEGNGSGPTLDELLVQAHIDRGATTN